MTLECYFDLACPYSQLAIHQLLKLQGLAEAIRWHPVDVEAVKGAAGNDGPALASLPQKARYVQEDVARWARHLSISDLVPPAAFARELNAGVFLARERGVELAYLSSVLRHCSKPDSESPVEDLLSRICEELHWRRDELVDFGASEQAQSQLGRSVAHARAAGVFGTPTFVVEGELWWGNDRLDQVVEKMIDAGVLQRTPAGSSTWRK